MSELIHIFNIFNPIPKTMKHFKFVIVSAMIFAAFSGCSDSQGEKVGFLQQVSERNPAVCDKYTVAEVAFIGGVAKEEGMTNAQEFRVVPQAVEAAHRLVGSYVTVRYRTTTAPVFCGPQSVILSVNAPL